MLMKGLFMLGTMILWAIVLTSIVCFTRIDDTFRHSVLMDISTGIAHLADKYPAPDYPAIPEVEPLQLFKPSPSLETIPHARTVQPKSGKKAVSPSAEIRSPG